MVLKATPLQQKEWNALPSRREMGIRRISSFIVRPLPLPSNLQPPKYHYTYTQNKIN